MAHIAPLGREHLALTGDYVWTSPAPAMTFRPFLHRPSEEMACAEMA